MTDHSGLSTLAALPTLLACVALALSVASEAAGAQVPVSLDHDRDGVVSGKEFSDARETSFARIDRDGNDVLTAAEFVQRPSGPAGTRPGVSRLDELRRRRFADLDANNDGQVSHAEYMEFGRRLFAAIDADRDGRLSGDEFRRFRPGRAKHGLPSAADAASRVFAALDGDGDGVLTAAEIETTRDRVFSRADRDGNGNLNRDEFHATRPASSPTSAAPPGLRRRADRNDRRFDELDRDKDGAITRAEYIADGRTRFAAADRNRDGRLTEDEFRTYRPGAK